MSRRGITVQVNDESRALAGDATLADLLRELGLVERKGIAIAVNNAIAPRASWPRRALVNGDRVLVIRATQGG